jgi:hypothetical protein
MIDRSAAEAQIKSLFAKYKGAYSGADAQLVKALTDGKLYELFVLADVVEALDQRGCRLSFVGSTLKFKAGPGMLKTSDPHFEVQTPRGRLLWLFVDIEFDTLGHKTTAASDDSRRHEIDIVVVDANTGYPTHDQIYLGVECKAVANFGKDLVKEALGVRRELSFFVQAPQTSALSLLGAGAVHVKADPPSEFWLAFIDPKGLNYSQSPAAFGIELHHLQP